MGGRESPLSDCNVSHTKRLQESPADGFWLNANSYTQTVAAHLLSAAGAIGEFAELAGIRDTLQWFTREKQWVNDMHLQLCRIPSPTFLEQQRADWMTAQF